MSCRISSPTGRCSRRSSKGDYETWRRRTIEEVEAAGHHELLNWHVLAGAMATLKRKPVILDYFETFIFQSDKCFAAFPPN